MDIRVLKYFVQVAKDRNFTRASEHLYISQPALSKTLKKLEHELGINLFDIRTTGVQLTDYGPDAVSAGCAADRGVRRPDQLRF